MVDSMFSCLTPRKKEVKKWKKWTNAQQLTIHLMSLCGLVAINAPSIGTCYKSSYEQTTTELPIWNLGNLSYKPFYFSFTLPR